jgi:hypothetical protein
VVIAVIAFLPLVSGEVRAMRLPAPAAGPGVVPATAGPVAVAVSSSRP